jgi:hypothetical protein
LAPLLAEAAGKRVKSAVRDILVHALGPQLWAETVAAIRPLVSDTVFVSRGGWDYPGQAPRAVGRSCHVVHDPQRTI